MSAWATTAASSTASCVISAASTSNMSATTSCRRLTVGSSPSTSSPTSAFAMTLRMSSDGLVTVSDRKSMCFMPTNIVKKRLRGQFKAVWD